MKASRINRWLTLAANFGVLIGIMLLLVELDQNAHVVRAQISSERTSQAIDIFMTVAESQALSGTDAMLRASGFPRDTSAMADLTRMQHRQYYWYLMAESI